MCRGHLSHPLWPLRGSSSVSSFQLRQAHAWFPLQDLTLILIRKWRGGHRESVRPNQDHRPGARDTPFLSPALRVLPEPLSEVVFLLEAEKWWRRHRGTCTHPFWASLGGMWRLSRLVALSGKESACQCRRRKRARFDPWVGKIPWRRAWQTTPVFLPGESHGQRSLGSQRLYLK